MLKIITAHHASLHGSINPNLNCEVSGRLLLLFNLVCLVLVSACKDQSAVSHQANVVEYASKQTVAVVNNRAVVHGEVFLSAVNGSAVKQGALHVLAMPSKLHQKFAAKVVGATTTRFERLAALKKRENYWEARMNEMLSKASAHKADASGLAAIELSAFCSRVEHAVNQLALEHSNAEPDQLHSIFLEMLSDETTIMGRLLVDSESKECVVVKTDGEGRFRLELEPDDYWLYAVAKPGCCWVLDFRVGSQDSKISLDASNLVSKWDDQRILNKAPDDARERYLAAAKDWVASFNDIPTSQPAGFSNPLLPSLPDSLPEIEALFQKLAQRNSWVNESTKSEESASAKESGPTSIVLANRAKALGTTLEGVKSRTGRILEKATIKRFDDKGIYFSLPEGGALVQWQDLPSSVVELYKLP